ncbi:glycosyltransferase [Methylobacterium sp. sgz302541]|uniref:glycosyltransferase n=1 Tax=unclassified Methylobacterium TaxID=2615210 RepID=UPI003D330B1D
MTDRPGLRVAVVGTNDPRNYSGGRYHGLMLAYAVAAAGGEAYVVTDHVPGFVADCEPLAPNRVKIHRTADFVSGLPEGRFDWVVVIPTGVFLPDFYEACLDFAANAGARVALVNFESANWFNALAPEPRDPRLWDGWRRLVIEGGLVLSSARESHAFAKQYYRARDNARLRFDIWSPPINSVAARGFDGAPKDGSLLAFVRPTDLHKGSGSLLQIDPQCFAGRTLRIVSGRELSESFEADLRAHLAKTKGATLEVLLRISDAEKFRIMTAAQVVLFPSRFEGFGYPPVEAAYAGTESVAFDLPVVRETVGSIAHLAPVGDMAAFSRQLSVALARPERRAELRRAVERFAAFENAAGLLGDVLLRSADSVEPRLPRPHRVPMGPFARTKPRPTQEVDREEVLSPLPSYAASARQTTGGDIAVTVTAHLAGTVERAEATEIDGGPVSVAWTADPAIDGFTPTHLHVVVPASAAGKRIRVTCRDAQGSIGDAVEFQIDRVEGKPRVPALCGISENAEVQGRRRIRGWLLCEEPLLAVLVSNDGLAWHRTPVDGTRKDVFDKNPGYPTSRCQFIFDLPKEFAPDPKKTRIVALGRAGACEVLTGWNPAPRSLFGANGLVATAPAPQPAPVAKPAPDVAPAAPVSPAARPQAAVPQTPLPMQGTLKILDLTDERWQAGIARTGSADRPGAVLVARSEGGPALAPGLLVRGASGTARTVRSVEMAADRATLVLDGALNPYLDGAPGQLDAIVNTAASGAASRKPNLTLIDWSDALWWRGVWNKRDHRWRRGFFLKTATVEALGLEVGALLRFPASGLRRIASINPEGRDTRIWLDHEIRPLGDGAPKEIEVVAGTRFPAGSALELSTARQGSGWPCGILDVNTPEGRPGTRVLLKGEVALARGTALTFASGRVARVLGTAKAKDGTEVALDTIVDPGVDGHPGEVHTLDELEILKQKPARLLFPDAALPARDPLHARLVADARRRGRVLPPARSATTSERPRILFLTLVPPAPANQGNRVVTRNFIEHLLDIGFDVDVLLQGWIDADEAVRAFGERVRIMSLPFPNWDQSETAKRRKGVIDLAATLAEQAHDPALAEALDRQARIYHPYFIVRDEVVETARMLVATHAYAGIVCNYTHMARVLSELAPVEALPPSCIITHDALSRLPTSFLGEPLDTMYRMTTRELEVAALDSAGSVVIAISRSEADYFREIGVQNPVVLCEYDAADEMRASRVPESGFSAKTLIFNGSGNSMNVAALNWFVDECWAEILAAVKDAKLVVCGKIGEKWRPRLLPNIEILGELDRDAMIALCAKASIAINPCVAGTGLKIKTVEAACIGLPSVCLPKAVEGLEDSAARFSIPVEDGPGFVAGCIALLTDERRWKALRADALAVAEERFSARAVYKDIDRAMGWSGKAASRRWVAVTTPFDRDHAGPAPEPTGRPDLAKGVALAAAGKRGEGRTLVEREMARGAGDADAAAMAARFALDIGDPWGAAQHGAIVIGQRPLDPEGYHLTGRGLEGAGQKEAARDCYEQGMLVAPWNAELRQALAGVLEKNGQAPRAEKVRRLAPPPLQIGLFDGSHPIAVARHALAGFTVAGAGLLDITGRRAALRLDLPPGEGDGYDVMLSFAVDRAADKDGARILPLSLTVDGIRARGAIALAGEPVQSLRVSVPARKTATGAAFVVTFAFENDSLPMPKIRLAGLQIRTVKAKTSAASPSEMEAQQPKSGGQR